MESTSASSNHGGGNNGTSKRVKQFSKEQLAVLHAQLQLNPFPEAVEVMRMSEETGLTGDQIRKWFEKQRYRIRVSALKKNMPIPAIIDSRKEQLVGTMTLHESPSQLISDKQLAVLEGAFMMTNVLDEDRAHRLADELQLPLEVIQTWFRSRRQEASVRSRVADGGLSDSDRNGSRRSLLFSDTITDALQKKFEENPFPSQQDRETLSRELNIGDKQIRDWFKRQRTKRRQRGEAVPYPESYRNTMIASNDSQKNAEDMSSFPPNQPSRTHYMDALPSKHISLWGKPFLAIPAFIPEEMLLVGAGYIKAEEIRRKSEDDEGSSTNSASKFPGRMAGDSKGGYFPISVEDARCMGPTRVNLAYLEGGKKPRTRRKKPSTGRPRGRPRKEDPEGEERRRRRRERTQRVREGQAAGGGKRAPSSSGSGSGGAGGGGGAGGRNRKKGGGLESADWAWVPFPDEEDEVEIIYELANLDESMLPPPLSCHEIVHLVPEISLDDHLTPRYAEFLREPDPVANPEPPPFGLPWPQPPDDLQGERDTLGNMALPRGVVVDPVTHCPIYVPPLPPQLQPAQPSHPSKSPIVHAHASSQGVGRASTVPQHRYPPPNRGGVGLAGAQARSQPPTARIPSQHSHLPHRHPSSSSAAAPGRAGGPWVSTAPPACAPTTTTTPPTNHNHSVNTNAHNSRPSPAGFSHS